MKSPVDSRLLPRFHPYTLAELETLPPLTWLIDRHIPESGLVLLYGPPGSYKSFLALDWALSVATGIPWLDATTKAGEAVYIYAEGVGRAKLRCQAWALAHKVAVPNAFRIVPCPVALGTPIERATFIAALEAVNTRPMLIVVDTLARCFGVGDENSTKDMNAFVFACDALRARFPGSTILVVHHTGHLEQERARGSIALTGATDAAFRCIRGKRQLKLTNPRQKDSEEVEPRWLDLVSVGESLAIKASDRAVASGDDVIWDALWRLSKLGTVAVKLSKWQEEAGKAQSTFMGARKRLVDAGRVQSDEATGLYRPRVEGETKRRSK